MSSAFSPSLDNVIRFRGDIHAEVVFEIRDVRNAVQNEGKNQLTTLSGKTGLTGREGFAWTVIASDSATPEGGPVGPKHTQSNTFAFNSTGVYQASSSHTGIAASISSAWLYNTVSDLFLCAGTFSQIVLSTADTLNIVYTVSFT